MILDIVPSDVAAVDQTNSIHIGLGILDGFQDLAQSGGIQGAHQLLDVHVAHQGLGIQRIYDFLYVENADQRFAGNDLKQLCGGENLFQGVQVNRNAVFQIRQKSLGNPVFLQEIGQSPCVDLYGDGGGAAGSLGIHDKPVIRDNRHRQCRDQGEHGEDDCKNLVEHLHNKTSFLCSDSASCGSGNRVGLLL